MKKLAFLFISIMICLKADPPAREGPPSTPPNQPSEEFNVDTAYGNQALPIYFSKDMTIKVGTTEIGFYGFFRGDMMSGTRIAGSTAVVKPNFVPLDTDIPDSHNQTIFDARSSRLGFKVEDQIDGIIMKGAMEVDGFTPDGDSLSTNSRHLRIRIVYGTCELPSHFFFLGGQYYTLAMHYPEIDMPTRVNIIFYPPGVINSRQPQFRVGYKQYFSKTHLLQYEVNAEQQGYNNVGVTTPRGGDTLQGAEQKWPVFTAKFSWLSDPFKLCVSYSGGRAYSIVNTGGTRLHTPVWGVVSTGSITWKNLILWGTLHHFVGLNGLSSAYFNQWALINQSTRLEAAKANGGAVAARYDFIKEHLWSDIMYGIEHVNEIPTSSLFSGNALKRLQNFRVNLIGSFWKHWQIGIEYERTWVHSFNGISGCDNMGHIALSYVFGRP